MVHATAGLRLRRLGRAVLFVLGRLLATLALAPLLLAAAGLALGLSPGGRLGDDARRRGDGQHGAG